MKQTDPRVSINNKFLRLIKNTVDASVTVVDQTVHDYKKLNWIKSQIAKDSIKCGEKNIRAVEWWCVCVCMYVFMYVWLKMNTYIHTQRWRKMQIGTMKLKNEWKWICLDDNDDVIIYETFLVYVFLTN